MRVTYAVSKADLVIIPVQGSILDANEAAEAIKLVKRTEKGFGRTIDYAILFTRLPAALLTRNFSGYIQPAQRCSDSGLGRTAHRAGSIQNDVFNGALLA